MKPSTKETIQHCSAVAMLIGGFALAVAGFIVPPTGQIHESVLGIFAECLIYAGSIFGVTIYIQTKYSELRTYLETNSKRKSMRKITDIIIQCSATPEGKSFTVADIDRWHRQRVPILRRDKRVCVSVICAEIKNKV